MYKPSSKRRKKNNAHIIPKEDLVREAREMEQKLIGKESRWKNGKNTPKT
jgi:hypothetical protein